MEKIKSTDWYLLPNGRESILRFPFKGNFEDLKKDFGKIRLATHAEIIAMNLGAPYPWGYYPDSSRAGTFWKEKRIGYGGLVHSDWFLLDTFERVGGASNVLENGPAARRFYLLTTGGKSQFDSPLENEGYAVVREEISAVNEEIYRDIHEIVAEHISADGGSVVISPVKSRGETIFIGFVGRCMSCPNPLRKSIPALIEACPKLKIEIHPDWKDWVV